MGNLKENEKEPRKFLVSDVTDFTFFKNSQP